MSGTKEIPDVPEFYGAKIKCLTCNVVIQSQYRHDWVKCDCVTDYIYIDGGCSYLRMGRGLDSKYSVIDMGNYQDETSNNVVW